MFLKSPDVKRKSFSIAAYELINRKEKIYVPLPKEIQIVLDKINIEYQSQRLTQDEATILLKERIRLAHLMSNAPKISQIRKTISEVNLKIFNNFWDQIYSIKYLVDPQGAQADFLRAINAIEPSSLLTITNSQVIKQISKFNISKQRRIIFRLRELFKYLNREVILTLPQEELTDVKYISLEEMNILRQHLPEPMNHLLVTLFHTGARLGEAMAMSPMKLNLHQSRIFIDSQIDTKGRKRPPKRRRGGHIQITGGLESVKKWVSTENKSYFRDKFQTILPLISEEKIGKRVTAHDLRHSHAIFLLGKGVNLTLISRQLRNRIEVCQKYYTGYCHQDESLDAIGRMLE